MSLIQNDAPENSTYCHKNEEWSDYVRGGLHFLYE